MCALMAADADGLGEDPELHVTCGVSPGAGCSPARGTRARGSCDYIRWQDGGADLEESGIQCWSRCLGVADDLQVGDRCEGGTRGSRGWGRLGLEREGRGDRSICCSPGDDEYPIPLHLMSPRSSLSSCAVSPSPPTQHLSHLVLTAHSSPCSSPDACSPRSRNGCTGHTFDDFELQGAGDEIANSRDAWTWMSTDTGAGGGKQPCLQRLEALSICWYPGARGGHAAEEGGGGEEREADEGADRAVLIAGLGHLPKLASLELSDWPVLVRSDLEVRVCEGGWEDDVRV